MTLISSKKSILLKTSIIFFILLLSILLGYLILPLFNKGNVLIEDISQFDDPLDNNQGSSNNEGNNSEDVQTGNILIGELQELDDIHYGSGEVRVFANQENFTLVFDTVYISNGPALVVYLSKKVPENGIRQHPGPGAILLGDLPGNIGSFSMFIGNRQNIEISDFHSVIIYCETFFTSFTYATLFPNI